MNTISSNVTHDHYRTIKSLQKTKVYSSRGICFLVFSSELSSSLHLGVVKPVSRSTSSVIGAGESRYSMSSVLRIDNPGMPSV